MTRSFPVLFNTAITIRFGFLFRMNVMDQLPKHPPVNPRAEQALGYLTTAWVCLGNDVKLSDLYKQIHYFKFK